MTPVIRFNFIYERSQAHEDLASYIGRGRRVRRDRIHGLAVWYNGEPFYPRRATGPRRASA